MNTDPFKQIRHVPHLYMIRSVESRLLREYINKDEGPFLDVGCGDGTFAKSLGLKDVYGIDIDKNAVNKNPNNGCYNKVFHADASGLPFPDEHFLTVFSNCSLEHMNRLEEVLNELRRVLKNRGKFIFTVPSSGFPEAVKNDRILGSAGLNSKDVLDEYNRMHNHVNIFDSGRWTGTLEKAGFEVLGHEHYLPGPIGGFVVRMDMLYTIKAYGTRDILRDLEKRHFGILGLPLRMRFRRYLENPHSEKPGTHLIMKAVKA
jgi:SAM-dependent methyltransferase